MAKLDWQRDALLRKRWKCNEVRLVERASIADSPFANVTGVKLLLALPLLLALSSTANDKAASNVRPHRRVELRLLDASGLGRGPVRALIRQPGQAWERRVCHELDGARLQSGRLYLVVLSHRQVSPRDGNPFVRCEIHRVLESRPIQATEGTTFSGESLGPFALGMSAEAIIKVTGQQLEVGVRLVTVRWGPYHLQLFDGRLVRVSAWRHQLPALQVPGFVSIAPEAHVPQHNDGAVGGIGAFRPSLERNTARVCARMQTGTVKWKARERSNFHSESAWSLLSNGRQQLLVLYSLGRSSHRNAYYRGRLIDAIQRQDIPSC